MALHFQAPAASALSLCLVLAGCSPDFDIVTDSGPDAPDDGLLAVTDAPDAGPLAVTDAPDAGPLAVTDAGVDLSEWIRFTLRADKIPTGAFQRLEDAGFEFEVLDGGPHEFRASLPFRSAFAHSAPFSQFDIGGLGPLRLSLSIADGGVRGCDQFENPSSIRIGRFDVVSRNASCVVMLERLPRCPGDSISGAFSGLLIDRTSGNALPVVDGAFSVRISFVSHGAPNPPGCVCVAGSSTTDPFCR